MRLKKSNIKSYNKITLMLILFSHTCHVAKEVHDKE